MKISKLLLKILVVLVLATALLVPSTFSWYNHNGSQTGDSMSYKRNNLPVSSGNISVVTKRYNTEKEHNEQNSLSGGDSNKLYYDIKGNKEYYGNQLDNAGDEISRGVTHFYGTTITNTGSAPAYVNLYLNDFTNSSTVKIGTLQPSLTDKGLSSSVHLANRNMVRVYFQVKNTNEWSASGATTYVVYKTKTNSNYQYKTVTNNIDLRNDTGNILDNVATKYVDLDDDTTEFFFATDGNNSGFDTTNKTVTQPWYRTNTITNIHSEVGYYLTGVADDTTFNAQYATFNIPGGVSVKTQFDKVSINKNQHAYVTLNKGTNYTGSSVSYAISGNGNISINGNTGYITANNSFGTNSTAEITTTITGSLGDTTTLTTVVTNISPVAGVPVALNVEVPGQSVNEDNETVNGTAEIVWYIDNSATSDAVQFTGIYYTK